ncbi:hypothetical protein SAMD00019534_069720, partial [Acytostelium subglobosum LB1]|uniref:hypothetical protein n=1 Tax=Acytostelium subglobosum LB1 TaxID=1410327 RepID=UPI0006450906
LFIILLQLIILNGVQSQTQHKVAVLLSDKALDFGFNYMINNGVINAQRYFNMTNIHVLENIKQDIFNQTVEGLINDGYDGIFASSIEMTAPTRAFARQYPKVRFLARSGTFANTTNMSFFTYNIGISYYIVGLVAGLMTKTGNIGYIGPGLPMLANYNANALFVGARRANRTDIPPVKVTSINTNSWIDEDVVAGGTQTLLDKGVDFIGNNQDDMTAEIMMIRAGLMGLGTNGFPQSQLYGQSIGTSIINDWSQVIINFVNLVVTNSSTSRKDYGDFGNGFL